MSIEALGSLGLFAVPFIPHLAKCLQDWPKGRVMPLCIIECIAQDPAAEVRRIAAVAWTLEFCIPLFEIHLEGHCFGCWKWKSSKKHPKS